MEYSLFDQLKKNLSWVFSSNVILAIANMLSMIYFVRIIGTEEVGRYATMIVGIELSLSVTRFGFNQFIILHPKNQSLYNTTFLVITIQSIICFLITIGLLGTLSLMGYNIKNFILPGSLLVIVHILGLYTTFFYARLEAKMEYKEIVRYRLISRSLGIGVAFLMLFWMNDLNVLVFRDFLTSFSFFIFILFLAKPIIQIEFSKNDFQNLLNFSYKVLGLNMLEKVALRVDYAIVRIMLGESSMGIYYAIRGLMEGIFGFVAFPIQTVIFTYYTKLTEKIKVFNQLYQYQWVLGVVLMVGILLTQFDLSPVINLVYGEEYGKGGYLVGGLFIYFFSMLWFENFKVFSVALEMHNSSILGRIMQIIILLVLVPTLTFYFGFTGSGIASGIATLCLALVTTFLLKKKIKKDKDIENTDKSIIEYGVIK